MQSPELGSGAPGWAVGDKHRENTDSAHAPAGRTASTDRHWICTDATHARRDLHTLAGARIH